MKTPRTFDGDRWYRNCRATQILTPLYHCNVPTFLATQKLFKVFFENSERDSIYTYPCYTDRETQVRNSMRTSRMNTDFIRAVIICIRAKAARNDLISAIPVEVLSDAETTEPESPRDGRGSSPERSIKKRRMEVKQPTFKVEDSSGLIETIEIRLYDDEDIKLFGIPVTSD